MPIPSSAQLPPPSSWEEFESLCADLFAAEWGDGNAVRNGRQGQRQQGVDIFGRPAGGGSAGVQCKGRRLWPPSKLTAKEIDEEVARACQFSPPLTTFTFATTAEDDARIEEHVRKISEDHRRRGLFDVHVFGWEELHRRIARQPTVLDAYYGFAGLNDIRNRLRTLETIAGDAARATAELVIANIQVGNAPLQAALEPVQTPSSFKDHPLYARLATASKRTAYQTNIVQSVRGAADITLQKNLYVPRDAEEEAMRALTRQDVEAELVVVQGEPGTGKSSLLWALRDRLEKERQGTAWLLDATELKSIFGPVDGGGSVLTPSARELFAAIAATGCDTFVLIDTVDLALTTREDESYLTWLLAALSAADIKLVVASRTGEARLLSPLSPHIVNLFDYSEPEFKTAVTLYSRAFVHRDAGDAAETEAEELLAAAAQGLPIREICRNPLTLRMLYAIYAPHEINAPDIDVVALYNEFWERRVVADIRSDAARSRNEDEDLSACAMAIGLCMLAEGAPEIARPLLERQLAAMGTVSRDVDRLLARGVLHGSFQRPDRLVRFFHQTFFEHAGAVGLVRRGGPAALRALADRFAAADGNLFLASVLERSLILAEDDVVATRDAADTILMELMDRGPAGMAVLVYAFVHRRLLPKSVTEHIRAKVSSMDAFTIERFMGIAANARVSRRGDLVKVLASVVNIKNSRWLTRSLDLLLRFYASNPQEVAGAIRSAEIGKVVRADITSIPQARSTYLEFLVSHLPRDPDWCLTELTSFFVEGLHRRSAEICLKVVGGLLRNIHVLPNAARVLEERACLGDPAQSSRLSSATIAKGYGRLFLHEWMSNHSTPAAILDEVEARNLRGLAAEARFEALVDLLKHLPSDEVWLAFERSASIRDRSVRTALARGTWAKLLPWASANWPLEESARLAQAILSLAGDWQALPRNAAGDIVFHTLRFGPFDRRLTMLLLGKGAEDAADWLDTTKLGGRLLTGALQLVPGAQKALTMLLENVERNKRLVAAAITQLKSHSDSDDATAIGLQLAARTGHVDGAIELLERAKSGMPEMTTLLPSWRQLVAKQRGFGNPDARRSAARIEAELARLGVDPELTWRRLSEEVQSEKDDRARSFLIKALGAVMLREGSTDTGLPWLFRFAEKNEPETRKAVLRVFSTVAQRHFVLVAQHIEVAFKLALDDKPDAELLAPLSNPLFMIYKASDPRVVPLMLELLDKCSSLPTHSCRIIAGTFRKQFALIGHQLTEETVHRLLDAVPAMNPYFGRMVMQGVLGSSIAGISEKIRQISENSESHAQIVGLAGRFLRTELRAMSPGRWPELYGIIELSSAPPSSRLQ